MSYALQEYTPQTIISLHKDIRFHPELTSGEKMFYAEIDSMSRNSKCVFSSRKLSKFFGVSHQTIINWVNKLVGLDLLEVDIDYKNDGCQRFLKSKR
jgi:predicted AAA+ superfamily ATPase